jgi:Ion transport protein
MYAILGMIIFGQVMRNGVMNDYVNFETLPNSFMTLFVVATGDTWSGIMASFCFENSAITQCLESPTYADYVINGSNVGCGNVNYAWAYFLSYMFVVNLIFLKIFIAIILQGYNDTQMQDSRLFNHDMNDRFQEVWTTFDPDVTPLLTYHSLI